MYGKSKLHFPFGSFNGNAQSHWYRNKPASSHVHNSTKTFVIKIKIPRQHYNKLCQIIQEITNFLIWAVTQNFFILSPTSSTWSHRWIQLGFYHHQKVRWPFIIWRVTQRPHDKLNLDSLVCVCLCLFAKSFLNFS